MKIITGKQKKAQKVVLYGPEGIGKSTFASHFPDPLFIDTEGSTAHLDVKRTEDPTSWTMLKGQIAYVIKNPTLCKTLVIDTADWAEGLAKDHLISTNGWKSIEEPGYGKGYTQLEETWSVLLNLLQEVIKVNVNVVLTAHSQIKKFEQPDEMGAYDRYELKLEKKTAGLTKEWADLLIFTNYKTELITDSKTKKTKAFGGKRMMYTMHRPAWDAKNRHNLPEELELDFKSIAHIFEEVPEPRNETLQEFIKKPKDLPPVEQEEIKTEPSPDSSKYEDIPKSLAELMFVNDVDESEIRFAVHEKGYFPLDMPIKNYPADFINGVLVGAWEQVFGMIKASREKIPFETK